MIRAADHAIYPGYNFARDAIFATRSFRNLGFRRYRARARQENADLTINLPKQILPCARARLPAVADAAGHLSKSAGK